MSAAFYAQMAETALTLLEEFGTAATLRRMHATAYDAATGEDSDRAVDEYATVVLFRNVKQASGGGSSIRPGSGIGGLDGHRVQESVRDVIFSNTVEPQIGDKLLIALEEWDVSSVEAVAPAGDAIVFKGQVSR